MFDMTKEHIALHLTIFESESLFDSSLYNVTILLVSGKEKINKNKNKNSQYFLSLLPSSLMKRES